MNTFDPVNDYVVDTILESVTNDFAKAKDCDDHFDGSCVMLEPHMENDDRLQSPVPNCRLRHRGDN